MAIFNSYVKLPEGMLYLSWIRTVVLYTFDTFPGELWLATLVYCKTFIDGISCSSKDEFWAVYMA